MASGAFNIRYPSAGGASSNPANGTPGQPAPTTATEVGGVGPDGNLHAISTDNTGNQNVNVVSSVLPTGAATAALQTTGNSALGSILLDLTNGTQITQITGTVPLPSGAATSALQTSGNASLTSLDSKSPALVAGRVPVDGSGVTQPISATALPLPSGASTSALQTTGNTSLASIDTKTPALGQSVKATSVPVTLASDQGALVISSAGLNGVTGTAAAANADAIPQTDVSGYGALAVQVTGTFAGTLTFQGSNDGTNFLSVNASSISSAITVPTQTTTAVGMFIVPVEFRFFRLRMTAFTSGSAVGTMSAFVSGVQDLGARNVFSTGGTLTTVTSVTTVGTITNALPTGTNAIGSVKNAPRAVANAPVYNPYATTPVTTTTYVTMIASVTTPASFIDIFDSSGQAMIIATGIAGSEVILGYIPPGGGSLNVSVTSGVRISYKALTANATIGYLLMNVWT